MDIFTQAHKNASIFHSLLGGDYQAYFQFYLQIAIQNPVSQYREMPSNENILVETSFSGKNQIITIVRWSKEWSPTGYYNKSYREFYRTLGKMDAKDAQIKALHVLRVEGFDLQLSDIGLDYETKDELRSNDVIDHELVPYGSGVKGKNILTYVEFKESDLRWMYDTVNGQKYLKFRENLIVRLNRDELLCEFEGRQMTTMERDEILLEREGVRKEEERLAALEFVGTVGEGMNLELTITGNFSFEGTYGSTNVWKMKDVNGNIFVKFGEINDKFITATDEDSESYVGDTVVACFQIKAHKTYKREKQTTLGRATMTEAQKQAAKEARKLAKKLAKEEAKKLASHVTTEEEIDFAIKILTKGYKPQESVSNYIKKNFDFKNVIKCEEFAFNINSSKKWKEGFSWNCKEVEKFIDKMEDAIYYGEVEYID